MSVSIRVTSNRRRSRGSAMVEAALVAPILLLITFSIADFGITTWMHHTLMFRAREAARWGVVRDFTAAATATSMKNIILHGSPTETTGSTIYGITASNININRMHEPSNEDRLVITISGFKFDLFTYIVAGQHSGKDIVVSLPVEDHTVL
jgi:Flp pilus assembly protein TadG